MLGKIRLIMILFIGLGLVIVGKLFYLQIIKHEEYTALALGQINKSHEIGSNRGLILDSNGQKLAVNEPTTRINANPSQMKDTSKDEVARSLAPLLGEDAEVLRNRLESDHAIRLKQNVSRDVASQIAKLKLEGISQESAYSRYYPLGQIVSNIVGFTNIDGIGQYGIEASFEEELRGNPGRISKSSDSLNMQIPTGERSEFLAQDGMSVVLTIDSNIQKMAYEEALKIHNEFEAEGVNIIIQEVSSGDILAMVSTPSYDNNNPKDPVNTQQRFEWSRKTNDQIEEDWYGNWTNDSITMNYEPGSTFKLITAASALEEAETNPNHHYYCTGYIRDIKDAPVITCVSHHDPFGDISMTEALAKSCNSSFVHMARDIGKEDFLRYIKAFGFGEKTDIGLNGEAKGIVAQSPNEITDLRLATMSYGYGIAVTPVQLVNAVNSFGNGGVLLKPRIVKELIDVDGSTIANEESNTRRQVVSRETAQTMLDLMEAVVEEGTASKAQSSKYRIGGKTGTAMKSSEDGGYGNEYMSSFIGMAPIENPEITVLVSVDSPQKETYGSLVAAPHAKNLIEMVLEYKGVDYSMGKDQEKDLVEVPDVTYMNLSSGGTKLTSKGLRYTSDYIEIDQTTIIKGQKPRPGQMVEPGTIVDLDIENNTGSKVIVPKLEGMSLDEASSVLEEIGLEFTYKGRGMVQDQDPKAGKKLNQSSKVDLILAPSQEEDTNYMNIYRDDTSQEPQDDLEDNEDNNDLEDQANEKD